MPCVRVPIRERGSMRRHVFLATEQMVEMLHIKERGDDPSDLIIDLVERFYLQHE